MSWLERLARDKYSRLLQTLGITNVTGIKTFGLGLSFSYFFKDIPKMKIASIMHQHIARVNAALYGTKKYYMKYINVLKLI
jgi:hypothetical protein